MQKLVSHTGSRHPCKNQSTMQKSVSNTGNRQPCRKQSVGTCHWSSILLTFSIEPVLLPLSTVDLQAHLTDKPATQVTARTMLYSVLCAQCGEWIHVFVLDVPQYCIELKHGDWRKVRWEFYKGQRDPWWEQCLEYSSNIEKDLRIWCSCWVWVKPEISWLWQTMFAGMVMCWGERVVMFWEGH